MEELPQGSNRSEGQNRKKINELEEKLVKFKKVPLDQMDNVEFDRINRELAWANKEIGYVSTERSAVIAWADSSPIGKKLRLYGKRPISSND